MEVSCKGEKNEAEGEIESCVRLVSKNSRTMGLRHEDSELHISDVAKFYPPNGEKNLVRPGLLPTAVGSKNQSMASDTEKRHRAGLVTSR